MLGTKNTWPASGEIDILEAGHVDGINAGTQNSFFNGALHWQHGGGYAGYGKSYTAPTANALNSYNKFTMIWSPTKIEMFFNDDAEPYYAMEIHADDIEEFRDWPHYFIVNLAVGGMFPQIYNPDGITAPLPAKMYVDYIRVYQQQGEGEISITPPQAPPTSDNFGVFTENPNITDKLIIDDFTTSIQIWDKTLIPIEGAPSYDGNESLNFVAQNGASWFGFGVNSSNGFNLSHFNNGYLKFSMRTTSSNNFWIGIGDINGKEGKVEFNNGSDPYGFQRDGQWHEVTIPISAFKNDGLDLSIAGNIFMMGGDGKISDILIDDIYLSINQNGISNPNLNPNRNDSFEIPKYEIKTDYYGIYTENPNIPNTLLIDDVNGHIYSWENTLVHQETTPYDGENVISFKTDNNPLNWWGFGIHDDLSHNLTHFNDGYISFAVKTTSLNSFKVLIGDGTNQGYINFFNGNDPSGFTRDGQWHRLTFSIAELRSQGLNLESVNVPFSVINGGTGNIIEEIAFDDIVFSVTPDIPNNPNLYTGEEKTNGNPPANWGYWLGDGGNAYFDFLDNSSLVKATVKNAGWEKHSIQLFMDILDMPNGEYELTFKAKADDNRNINASIGKSLDADPWFLEFMPLQTYSLTNNWQEFTHTFTKTNENNDGRLVFELGAIEGGTIHTNIYFNDVSVILLEATKIENSFNDEVTISPNPATDILNVYTKAGETIEIFTINGQKIVNTIAENDNNSINVSHLPSGVYLVKTLNTINKVVIK